MGVLGSTETRRPAVDLTSPGFVPGKAYRRSVLHERYGGQRQSGISTPAGASFVLLFSSPKGEAWGYDDGWIEGDIYRFTGEGQHGDMQFVRGNKAVRDHEQSNKSLHLFEDAGHGLWRYVCRLRYMDHSVISRADGTGRRRSAIVFRLQVDEP